MPYKINITPKDILKISPNAEKKSVAINTMPKAR